MFYIYKLVQMVPSDKSGNVRGSMAIASDADLVVKDDGTVVKDRQGIIQEVSLRGKR